MRKPAPGVPIVAVDTGGTFTDVVVLRDGALSALKVPSTPDDPARAVLDGIRAALPPGAAFVLVHGSTVATNTLLERTGARVALVTNRGFEDVIEIGRQNRPQLYAIVGHRPPPLVAREDRHGIAGRVGPDGAEIAPLDDDELAALAPRLAGAEAVAVCLLHSYARPEHEERVAAALEPLGLPLSVSARLLPEYREYERTATTVDDLYMGRMSRASSTVTISSAMVAWGFAYFRVRGRGFLFGLVLATMMLPGAVTMIPTFLIWNALGQVGTLRMFGSGTMDVMAIASGQWDVLFQHSVADWDRLPGAAIIRGAGGDSVLVPASGVTWTVTGAPAAVADVRAALLDR